MRNKKLMLAAGIILLVSGLFIGAPVLADTDSPEEAFNWQSNHATGTGYFRNYGTGWGVRGLAESGNYGVYGLSLGSGGQGVRGYASATTGTGVWGRSVNYIGVRGQGGAGGGDYGGYFTGYEGVRGIASGLVGYGTWGSAYGDSGIGAYGYASGTSGYGVYGYSSQYVGVQGYSGAYIGVRGRGGTGSGDYGGFFEGYEGVRGVASGSVGYGTWGHASGTSGRGAYGYASGAAGYGVYGYSSQYIGVRGRGGSSYGGYFYSSNYRGLYANAGNAGWYDLYVPDFANIAGTVFGPASMSMIALNDSAETLEPGDLVVFAGFDSSALGSARPALSVAKAGQANGGAVMGVVQGAYVMETPAIGIGRSLPSKDGRAEVGIEAALKDTSPLSQEPAPEGEEPSTPLPERALEKSVEAAPALAMPPVERVEEEPIDADTGHFVEGNVEPGQYVLIAIQGFVPVKVNAARPIQAGDWVTAAADGYAMAATAGKDARALSGGAAIIGRAMESLDKGSGMIYVYVNFR